MSKFLYVFTVSERDMLLSLHFQLLKSDDRNEIYVFQNRDDIELKSYGVNAIESDVLTF